MEPPSDKYVQQATAHQHGGAGWHEDKRRKRRRTRQADRWASVQDNQEDKNNG